MRASDQCSAAVQEKRSTTARRAQIGLLHDPQLPCSRDDPEDVAYHLVHQDVAREVADNLMNLHDRAPLPVGRKPDRLDVEIDHRPLPLPVTADGLAAMLMAALHPVCPFDIGMHRAEHDLHVVSVERR